MHSALVSNRHCLTAYDICIHRMPHSKGKSAHFGVTDPLYVTRICRHANHVQQDVNKSGESSTGEPLPLDGMC